MIEQAKFTYCPLGKVLEKQTKTIEEQGKPNTWQLTIKNVILENILRKEANNELNDIDKIEKTINM